jgi:precorrin-4/cobalt-precorrin-4 C11-methyltransferase
MKVYFIGAGPGAPDLITVRGADILSRVSIVMYAGSLVPEAVLKYCKQDAEIINTAELNLEEQFEVYDRANKTGQDVVRLHSGDPSIYGATAEQMRGLEQMNIPYEIVPGVSSFTAAAAVVGTELTKPGISQTIILTRVSGRASAVPDDEQLAQLAAHRATLCIFLSGPHLSKIVQDLLLHYPPETPVALVYRATSPDERIHRSTLAGILYEVDVRDWKLTTMMLVGRVLEDEIGGESRLYSADYSHLFRRAKQPQEVR